MGDLDGKVALVAGATRGAGRGIARALGERGATVYVAGRSTRARPGGRPETIEETAELVGPTAVPLVVDLLDPDAVRAAVARIDAEQGRLDVLVNDAWGGEGRFAWDTPLWEQDLATGIDLLRNAVETHLTTSHAALPLLLRHAGGLVVEMTDGTLEYNAANYRVGAFYDLAKWSVLRLAFAQAQEVGPRGATAVAVTPGWLRSEMMLEAYGVTEETWRDVGGHFGISETPLFVGRGIAALAADPDKARWNGRSTTAFELATTYDVTDVDGSRPDCWRYMVEVQDRGLEPNPEPYRSLSR